MRLAFVTAAVLLLAAPSMGQPQRVGPGTGSAFSGSHFGRAIALGAGVAAVGAPLQGVGGTEAGALYLFDRGAGDWTEAAWLTVAEVNLRLGASVAVGDGFVVAGAPQAGATAGAVMVARPDGGWAWTARIDGPEPTARFGTAVAADGDRMAVSVPGHDRVVVYRSDGAGWTVEADLAAAVGGTAEALALDGDRLAVRDGASVVVYRWDGAAWGLSAAIAAPPGAGRFGDALALDGDRLAVAAPNEDEGRGAVYLYDHDGAGWGVPVRLVAPRREPVQLFGNAVALDGDRLVVGAENDPTLHTHAGRALVFDRGPGGWAVTADLVPSASTFYFGNAVAVDGETVVIGNAHYGSASTPPGAAWVYRFSRPTDAEAGPDDAAVRAVPNPTAGPVRLAVSPRAPGTVRVVVMDAVGRRVAVSEHAVGAGPRTLALDLGGLPPGLYLWRAEGVVRATGRITVAR